MIGEQGGYINQPCRPVVKPRSCTHHIRTGKSASEFVMMEPSDDDKDGLARPWRCWAGEGGGGASKERLKDDCKSLRAGGLPPGADAVMLFVQMTNECM